MYRSMQELTSALRDASVLAAALKVGRDPPEVLPGHPHRADRAELRHQRVVRVVLGGRDARAQV